MTNTPAEIELFGLVAQMHKHHSVALRDDGMVSIAKLNAQGEPYEFLPLFPSVQDAINWAKRINQLKPWEMAWSGPG